MLLTSCLGRLGSRYSLILDPVRKTFQYGALGLNSQMTGEFVIGLDDGQGNFETLPFTNIGSSFNLVDEQMTMTSVIYEAFSTRHGALLRVEIISPFYPRDEKTSCVPAYILKIQMTKLTRIRAKICDPVVQRWGLMRIGMVLPEAEITGSGDCLNIDYPVRICERTRVAGDGVETGQNMYVRTLKSTGYSYDAIFGIKGNWQVEKTMLEAPFDLSEQNEETFVAAMVCHCNDTLFERMGKGLRLKYTRHWQNRGELIAYVRANWGKLVQKSAAFDSAWNSSSLPTAAKNLTAYSFQSYLMNTLWAANGSGRDWFSVWEGNCLYNSTVDVTYNEAMFYFACWPELLEKIIAQWSQHGNSAAKEAERLKFVPNNYAIKSLDAEELHYPGLILEHDMGAGWTANGQTYPHAMPVEENSNFLLLLYAHGCWWGKKDLFSKYNRFNKDLVDYLLWTDSTGNGFPDRGRANTFDDSSPALQYGRDNVYLGVKRLCALHAAMRMFEYTGEKEYANTCKAEVRKATQTLQRGWLGDHYPICLDKSTKGLKHCLTGEPLPYKVLPGWNEYNLPNSNGLLYLLMVDDVPAGLKLDYFKTDLKNAVVKNSTPYGTSHSGKDNFRSVWVSANIWRDCIAAYLGENMLDMCQKYWDLQVFSNALGSDKTNCFTECLGNNNLVWYPRGIASMGLMMAIAGEKRNLFHKKRVVSPLLDGVWPVISEFDWKKRKGQFVVASRSKSEFKQAFKTVDLI